MDVGMVEQILPPGVQEGEESDFGTQVRRVGGDNVQRRRPQANYGFTHLTEMRIFAEKWGEYE